MPVALVSHIDQNELVFRFCHKLPPIWQGSSFMKRLIFNQGHWSAVLQLLHELPHVIRLGLLKILPLPETRNFGLMSNLLRDLCPARESPPEVSQKVGEAFLSHLRIWYVK